MSYFYPHAVSVVTVYGADGAPLNQADASDTATRRALVSAFARDPRAARVTVAQRGRVIFNATAADCRD